MIKKWKPIVGFKGLYSINISGEILNRKSNKIRKNLIDRYGYFYIRLFKNGSCKHFTIHRLLALHFIPNPKNYPQVNHIDGNKQNNSLENLEWCTSAMNRQHSFKVLGQQHAGGSPRKRVKQIEKNIIYNSIWEAWLKTGISCGSIHNVCSGRTKTAGGFKWEFVNGYHVAPV